jgi:DNA-binding MarR family transcriptional regulator
MEVVEGRLLKELRQTKPYRTLEEEAFVSLLTAADRHQQVIASLLKTRGLSPAQYNVLRILRGAGKAGLPCGEIAGRMITRDSDITRLLDRLEAKGLVNRTREAKDRRVITARITPAGFRLVNDLDGPVTTVLERQLGRVGEEKLKRLIRLLDEIRSMEGVTDDSIETVG